MWASTEASPYLQTKTLMSLTPQPSKPRFTAVRIYNHLATPLSFWYPPEWRLQETDTPHPAVSLYPDPSDEATFVSITVQDMGQPLAEEESSLLAEGVQDGLAQLEDCVIERLETLSDVGDWCQEWVCAFAQNGISRRRRARLFCAGRYLYSVVAQGSTAERYKYWQGMLEWVMLTVLQSSTVVSENGPPQ